MLPANLLILAALALGSAVALAFTGKQAPAKKADNPADRFTINVYPDKPAAKKKAEKKPAENPPPVDDDDDETETETGDKA